MLLHEADASKGGWPLESLRQECPDAHRAAVFEGNEVIQWHRVKDFQSLRVSKARSCARQSSPQPGDALDHSAAPGCSPLSTGAMELLGSLSRAVHG